MFDLIRRPRTRPSESVQRMFGFLAVSAPSQLRVSWIWADIGNRSSRNGELWEYHDLTPVSEMELNSADVLVFDCENPLWLARYCHICFFFASVGVGRTDETAERYVTTNSD